LHKEKFNLIRPRDSPDRDKRTTRNPIPPLTTTTITPRCKASFRFCETCTYLHRNLRLAKNAYLCTLRGGQIMLQRCLLANQHHIGLPLANMHKVICLFVLSLIFTSGNGMVTQKMKSSDSGNDSSKGVHTFRTEPEKCSQSNIFVAIELPNGFRRNPFANSITP